MKTAVDPIVLEIVNSKVTSIVDEMRVVLFHSGYSTILRESEDGSVGLLDAELRTVATPKKLPLHFSSFTTIADHLTRYYKPEELEEGDVIFFNHPFAGNTTHPQDTTALMPIFVGGSLVAYTASLAHKPDLGGPPRSKWRPPIDLWEGGLLIPPVKLYQRGIINPEIERLIAANSRQPKEILGDLRGQVAACRVGARRLQELCARFGADTVMGGAQELIERTANRLRKEIGSFPDGTHQVEAFIEIGIDRPVRVHLEVTKQGEEILFDFSGSDNQTSGTQNANSAVINNACYFGLMAMTDPNLPFNHGFAEVVKTRFKEGTIFSPRYGAFVSGHVTMGYFVANLVLRALGEFRPDKAVGGSGGGGGAGVRATGKLSGFNELVDTALGATGTSDGVSLIHGLMGMGQFRPGPIEIHETEFPLRIARFDVRTDSGGPGKFRGGLGCIREYQVLEEARVGGGTGAGQRQFPPWGVFGGQSGRPGTSWVNSAEQVTEGSDREVVLKPGDIFHIETTAGGGYGDPLERDPETVLGDVLEGYVSVQGARDDYGVVISEETLQLDLPATGVLRRKKRKQTQQLTRTSRRGQ
ncbi:MAG: hydantoinase B/oxoprolinase family protein [Chloroflexi bacterium]|nr:hydantoinase B/oxoprolinase family protein [Chloroflexota bacterium]